MKNSMDKIKNTLERMNKRLEDAEEWISDLEDNIMKSIQAEQLKEKVLKEMRIG